MTNAELIQAIRNEIERQRKFIEGMFTEGDNNFYDGQDDAYNNILTFLSTLEESNSKDFPTTDEEMARFLASHPKVDVPDRYKTPDWMFEESEKPSAKDAMKELNEKIALVKERGTWDGVNVDKYMDEVRGREPEKPMVQDGLEEEMDRFFETMQVLEHENIFEDTFKNIARHFYDLGCRRTAEKYDEIEYNRQREEEQTCNGFEEEFRQFIKKEKEEEPDGSLPCYGDYGIYRIARHFAQWGAEHAKIDVTDFCKPIDPGIAQCIADHSWEMLGEDEKPVPNDLEEGADNHIRRVADAAGHPGWDWTTQDIADAFIAGAKWQKSQMMKEAVEGKIIFLLNGDMAINIGDMDKYNLGDKVRVIFCKKDD